MSGQGIGQAWREVRDQFRAAGIATAELDARLLAEMTFHLKGVDLITHERDPVPAAELAALQELAARRLAGEPVARITGVKEFYGLPFKLVPETLVPRPETELLVDFALATLPPMGSARILDLGTGSGCIAIAILVHLKRANALAIDISKAAIACANRNAKRHAVSDRFEARVGSWFTPLVPAEGFDLIVSNPPYIESAAIPELMQEVRGHDPIVALDGGPDGLNPYRTIAFSAASWLKPGGIVALEIGATQGPAVASLLTRAGLKDATIKKDLAGLDRMAIAHHSMGRTG